MYKVKQKQTSKLKTELRTFLKLCDIYTAIQRCIKDPVKHAREISSKTVKLHLRRLTGFQKIPYIQEKMKKD